MLSFEPRLTGLKMECNRRETFALQSLSLLLDVLKSPYLAGRTATGKGEPTLRSLLCRSE